MFVNGFGVQVIVDGKPLAEINKNGKTYLAAPLGKDFLIRLTVGRHFYGRFESVVTVDGLDIITGKDGSVNNGGYIIKPGQIDIPGFRLSDSEVAAFHFGERGDSYADKLGKPKNVGVIGAVFFSEKPPIRISAPVGQQTNSSRPRGNPNGKLLTGSKRGSSFNMSHGVTLEAGGGEYSVENCSFGAPAAAGPLRSVTPAGLGHDVGTEFGQTKGHEVSYTSFIRQAEMARIVLEYASEQSLIDAGIIVLAAPTPFPADPVKSNEGFCRPPVGWSPNTPHC